MAEESSSLPDNDDDLIAGGWTRRDQRAARLVEVEFEIVQLQDEKKQLTTSLETLDKLLEKFPRPAKPEAKAKTKRDSSVPTAVPVRGVKSDLAVYIEEWKHTVPSEHRSEDTIVAAMGRRLPGSKKAAVVQSLIHASNPLIAGRVLERFGTRGAKFYRFWSDTVRRGEAEQAGPPASPFSTDDIEAEIDRVWPQLLKLGDAGASALRLSWADGEDGGDRLLTKTALETLLQTGRVEESGTTPSGPVYRVLGSRPTSD